MSKNRNRALALASGLALVASGLAAAPAVAATGVELTPTSGTKFGSLANESFSLSNSVSSQINGQTTAYQITTDEEIVKVTLKSGSTNTTGVTILGFDAFGNAVDLDSIDDTSDTSDSKDANSNFKDDDSSDSDSNGASDDGLGTPTVASGAFTIDLKTLGLAGFTIYESSFNTTIDSASSTPRAETLIVQPMKTTSTAYAYGDGSPEPITVQSWVESEATADYSTIDAAYAGGSATLTWVDPKSVAVIPTIERFSSGNTDYFNDDDNAGGNTNLGGSINFVNSSLNLDQLDDSLWNYQITKADGTEIKATATLATRKLRNGFTKHDDAGKVYYAFAVGATLDRDQTYKVVIDHDGATGTDFGSVAYSMPNPGTTDYQIEATIDTADDNAIQSAHTDNDIEVLTGVNSRVFTAQIKTSDDTAAEVASIPVMAVVEYPSTQAQGVLTVSGTSDSVSTKSGFAMTNGFTDSDGQFKVTVTSSTALKGEKYTVSFYTLKGASNKSEWTFVDDSGASEDAVHTITYTDADADGTSLAADNSVLSGASVTATFTVTDNFGKATNVDGTKPMQIELKATDTTKLKAYADVDADGTASFTFDNYLGAGGSDVLTATLFTGTSTDQTSVDTATLTLYNASDIAAVQVPETISTAITYDDFLSGGAKTSAAAPAPNDGNVELKGTVVDSNGAGIPGTPVTISGAGLQFVEDSGTKYYTDSITVNTTAAGVFDIDVYSHIVNTTGVDVTVTAGGVSSTTTLKTYLPTSGVDGNNLAFSMDMPAEVVMNKTYAVTVSLTDKWGNPIATNDTSGNVSGLSILGTGSVQINSSDSATTKNFGKDGTTTVFLRSVKDIAGPGAVAATLQAAEYTGGSVAGSDQGLTVTAITTDVTTTAWDETVFDPEISTNVEVYESASDIPAAAGDTKVNAGSFKGYVAVYARGYEGQRLSAKIGADWVIVDPIVNNQENGTLFRVTDFTGAGVDIAVRIYIDRVLIDTINLTTK